MLLNRHVMIEAAAGIAMVLVVRYTLRKVLLHDLRGIRLQSAVVSVSTEALPARPATAASA